MPGLFPASLFVKDYYSILRVSRSADIRTIKRSYRLLVQKYHPDVNPDPQAAELIKEINEAYDVLSDVSKKSDYDYRFINPYSPAPQPEEPAPLRNRDPYFKRRGFRPVSKTPTQHDLVLQYFHFVNKICIAGLVICFVLIVDYNLPRRSSIVEIQVDYQGGRDYVLIAGQPFSTVHDELFPFEGHAQAELLQSFVLGKIIEVRRLDGKFSITTFGTIYGTFKFVPIIVFVTALICLFMRDNLEFRFGLCVLTVFALFFTIVLMFG